MKKHNAKELISKYAQGATSPEEDLLVEQWFNQELQQAGPAPDAERIEQASQRVKAALLAHINARKAPARISRLWPRLAIAATVLIVVATGVWFAYRPTLKEQQQTAYQIPNIAPATNKAVLTLANGKQITLASAQNGQLATQNGITVSKTADGELNYQGATASAEVNYNMVSIPRGGRQYHLVLADGSNVWLNAASSIRYPTAFNARERVVELSGEAYFEVAHQSAHPFKVKSKQQMVEVLGTHFNVNAYDDEPALKTTLLQGRVKVSRGDDQFVVLQPGQQASVGADNYNLGINVNNADTEQVMAWKNDEFNFDNTDVPTMLRQISRWYDVDIEYRGHNTDKLRLSGTFSRNMNAANAFRLLQFSGLKLRSEGRKIIIE